MICRIGDVVRRGRVVSVTVDVDPGAVAAAVRQERGPDDRIAVFCPEPSALHESVGCLHPEMGLRTKTALARAARTRGETTPYDERLRELQARLDEMTVESHSIEAAREAVANAEAALEEARIRAAEKRGRLRERRDQNLPTGDAESRLQTALRELSEAETEAIAARQTYEQARERRRERRDIRERKRRLEDRLANLERRARSQLVEEYRERFRETLATVPGAADPDDPFEADPVTAALAIGRLGVLAAPVVLAVDRFDSPAAAGRYLDAPVVRV